MFASVCLQRRLPGAEIDAGNLALRMLIGYGKD